LKVILVGPPGAGKGTQASRIAEHLKIPKVASGDLFREHRAKNTELGQLAKSYMDKGALVPDEVTIKMVMDWIEKNAKNGGFLLDGFPRTLPQAQALDAALKGKGGINRVLYIKVSEDELVRRLSGRRVCRSCQAVYNVNTAPPKKAGVCDACGGELYQREDDKPEAVKHRIKVVYLQDTAPLVAYYKKAGVLREINGERSIEEVGQDLIGAVKR